MGERTVETKALQGAPFFAGLSPEDIGGILQVGRPVSFEPGQAMVEQGDAGDGMYIIVSGTAEVDVGGRFHKLTTGDFFGEMALFTAGKRMATVKAVETVRRPEDPRGRVPVVLARAPRGRPLDAAGGRGASP